MLIKFLSFWVKITSWFFFDRIVVEGIENTEYEVPLLIASNHPNSFLDSLLITILIKKPIYYTAKGDIFNTELTSRLLKSIHLLPMYRKEEGVKNLYKNELTFKTCMDIFKKNGIISIFSEGSCENEWELRTMRKGTARLSNEAWNNPAIGNKLKVIPVAINYSSWHKTKPVVYISFLKSMEMIDYEGIENGQFNRKFNEDLKSVLSEKCVILEKSDNMESQKAITGFILKNIKNGLEIAKQIQEKYAASIDGVFKTNYRQLADYLIKENIEYYNEKEVGIVAFSASALVFTIACVLNAIPCYLAKFLVHLITKEPVYHDSLLFGLLMVIYPVYLVTLLLLIPVHFFSFNFILFAVFSAYLYEKAKRNLHCFLNGRKINILRELLSKLTKVEMVN